MNYEQENNVYNLVLSTLEKQFQKVHQKYQRGNLWLGGQGAITQNYIKQAKIGAIVTIIGQYTLQSYEIEKRIKKLGIKHYKKFILEDSRTQNICQYFDESNTFLSQTLKNTNVLVHCMMGISRSATLVIAFIMKKYQAPLKHVLDVVKKKRQCVEPNKGFIEQLISFEQICLNFPEQKPVKEFKKAFIFCSHIVNIYQKNEHPVGNVYLGGIKSFKQNIFENGAVTAVLTILDQQNVKISKIKQILIENKLPKEKYKQINIQDQNNVNIRQHFKSCHQFLLQNLQNGNVLVHCLHGVSRSATIVISFIMKQKGIDYISAYKIVKKKRQNIKPNNGFIQQLKDYERDILKKK